jgi:hypothetical protein
MSAVEKAFVRRCIADFSKRPDKTLADLVRFARRSTLLEAAEVARSESWKYGNEDEACSACGRIEGALRSLAEGETK